MLSQLSANLLTVIPIPRTQIITRIIEAPMVIADMTGHNPNVFYELAIRHAYGRPVVKIIQSGESIPFDVGQSRTIFLDHTDLESVELARQELTRQIQAAANSPDDADNPVTEAVRLQRWQESDDPAERRDAEILGTLQDLSIRLSKIETVSRSREWRDENLSLSDVELLTVIKDDNSVPAKIRGKAARLVNDVKHHRDLRSHRLRSRSARRDSRMVDAIRTVSKSPRHANHGSNT